MQVLAADLLAQRARELLTQVAFGSWPPALKLRDALQTYGEIRTGSALKDAQVMTVIDLDPAPNTQRSQVRP